MVIFPKETLIKLISYLDEPQMKNSTKEIANHIIEYFQFLLKTHIQHFSDEMLHQIITKFLSSSGIMWFDQVEFTLDKNKGKFQSAHNSGLKWSQFTSLVVQKICQDHFHYKIFENSIINGRNSIYFEFSL